MTRSHGFAQDIIARGAAAYAAAHRIVAVMNAEVGSYRTPQPARNPLIAIVGLGVGLGHIAAATLVVNRSRDCRNPDLAVAVVEIGVLPGGVLLLLRYFHFHCTKLQSFLAF